MKTPIKQITRPELKSARRLSPLDLNQIHVDKRHTVLTPEQIAKLSAASNRSDNIQ